MDYSAKIDRRVRMVSPSVRAAQGLPKTIKTQSVPNQLAKGGAKPVELEYAGLGDWLGEQGDRVSADEVVSFLESKGPLGRVKRLDAKGDGDLEFDGQEIELLGEDDAAEAVRVANERYDRLDGDTKKFTTNPEPGNAVGRFDRHRLQGDTARPVRDAWPSTGYSRYTEGQAHGWDEGDYREVYWVDPKTVDPNATRRMAVFSTLTLPGPVNAHDTDAWIRYHMNRDRNLGKVIDVQNVQSDIGQALARRDAVKAIPDKKAELWDGYRDKAEEHEYAIQGIDRQIRDVMHTYRPDILKAMSQLPIKSSSDGAADEVVRMIVRGHDNVNPVAAHVLQQLPDEARRELMVLRAARHDAAGRMNAAQSHVGRMKNELASLGMLQDERTQRRLRGVVPSNLFYDNTWMQLPARHVLLESAAEGGIPIRSPLGVNVSAIENMPRNAAKKMYEDTWIRTLQKALRPIGGSDVRVVPGSQMHTFEWDRTPYGDNEDIRTLRVGPSGERAGVILTPRPAAVEHIQKRGLDFLSLLLLTGAGAAASGQKEQKPGVLNGLTEQR